PDGLVPLASVAKVPIAAAELTRISDGVLAADDLIRVEPAEADSASPTGAARFRHPAWLSVGDLLTLSVCFSDNTATDALLRLVPIAEVRRALNELGVTDIQVRHRLGDLGRTPLERLDRTEAHLAYDLAATGPTQGDGHRIWQLDVSRANAGTAAGLADLLAEVWRPRRMTPESAARLRELMSGNVVRHRLAPDLSSEAAMWSSKTGTLLHLRHEIGVVDHADGQSIAIVVLSESGNPASVQPAAEAALGAAARALHDLLRRVRDRSAAADRAGRGSTQLPASAVGRRHAAAGGSGVAGSQEQTPAEQARRGPAAEDEQGDGPPVRAGRVHGEHRDRLIRQEAGQLTHQRDPEQRQQARHQLQQRQGGDDRHHRASEHGAEAEHEDIEQAQADARSERRTHQVG